MKNTVVSKRYAEALFELAQDKNIVTKVQEDMKLITSTFLDNGDLSKLFFQPIVAADDKRQMFESLFKGKIDEFSLNFVNLLLDKKRESLIFEVKEVYEKMVNALFSRVVAQVYTAIDLKDDKQSLETLTQSLEKYLNKSVEIETYVDESIVGGVLVKIGDRVIDGTLKSKLDGLARSLN